MNLPRDPNEMDPRRADPLMQDPLAADTTARLSAMRSVVPKAPGACCPDFLDWSSSSRSASCFLPAATGPQRRTAQHPRMCRHRRRHRRPPRRNRNRRQSLLNADGLTPQWGRFFSSVTQTELPGNARRLLSGLSPYRWVPCCNSMTFTNASRVSSCGLSSFVSTCSHWTGALPKRPKCAPCCSACCRIWSHSRKNASTEDGIWTRQPRRQSCVPDTTGSMRICEGQ